MTQASDVSPRDPATHSSAVERKRSFEAEDGRWERRQQWRDWMILLVMIALSLGYHMTIYALEPGLR